MLKKSISLLLLVIAIGIIFCTGYYAIKKNTLMKQGELVTSESLNTDLSAPDAPIEVKLVRTVVAPDVTIKNFRLFPSGNIAYIKNNSLFYNDELILEIGQDYTVGNVEEIGGKIVYELSYKFGESVTLFYDKKSVVPVGYTYRPYFKDVGGKLAYYLLDDKTKISHLFYDNKMVTDDALSDIRKDERGSLYKTDNVSKGERTEILFYNTEKIAEAEMFFNYAEIDGKIAYTTITSIDYYHDVHTLYYDGKKIGDNLKFLPEVKGKLAYLGYNKFTRKFTLYYDGEKINSYSKKYYDIDNIKESKGNLYYTISSGNQTFIFSNDKKIAEVNYYDSNFFESDGKVCYRVADYNKQGLGSWNLFCNGQKIRSNLAAEFGEVRGKLTYKTYDQVSKKYTLFYNEKEIVTADNMFSLVYDKNVISGPMYILAIDKKGGDSMYSIYRIQ